METSDFHWALGAPSRLRVVPPYPPAHRISRSAQRVFRFIKCLCQTDNLLPQRFEQADRLCKLLLAIVEELSFMGWDGLWDEH